MRIGLALSGGGFRASIFHLGVIRRLEELGIMKDVDVVSTVSGGSIIGAYYLCEMEKRLREVPVARQHDPAARVEIFEMVATDFLRGVDENLRTRALVFTPFYHPILFLKTIFLRAFRASARAELIQTEYDRWFYDGNTLDHLPAVTTAQINKERDCTVLFGPKLILNTTSLLTGEAVTFSRQTVSGMLELSKVNRNVLPLSRVVGASSGVPVLFPPTSIAGDLLVDGGVADNQGVCSLLDGDDACDFLLVSDASGQLEQSDSMGTGEVAVYSRTNSILMHQVRDKVIRLLLAGLRDRGFAFIHLFLNLKDRPEVTARVSSEFIPAIARLRTDLDQFSYIEREALMYHGYTLIDAQLQRHNQRFLTERFGDRPLPPMVCPPLFRESVQHNAESRKLIRRDLEAGAQALYLMRCFQKYGWLLAAIWVAFSTIALGILAAILSRTHDPIIAIRRWVEGGVLGLIPRAAQHWLNRLLHYFGIEFTIHETVHELSGLLSVILLFALALYLAAFPSYELIRRLALKKDRQVYKDITNQDPSVAWGKSQPPREG
jgi:predicted acylesterase/phospholipase RssA